MSYYMCKNITLKPKTNQIFVTVASNNVKPITYCRNEYSSKENCSLDDKLMYLMISMLDGNIQISQINKNTIPFEYALIKLRNNYREQDINEYGNKYDKRYELYEQELSKYVDVKNWQETSKFEQANKELVNEIKRNINRNLYKTEFEIFKKAIEEKIPGKYYIKDDSDQVIEYVRELKYGYRYRVYDFPHEDCLLDYKLAYIRQNIMGRHHRIEKLEEKQHEHTITEEEEENIE